MKALSIIAAIILSLVAGYFYLEKFTCKNYHDIELTEILKENFIKSGLSAYINFDGELCHIKDYKINTKQIIQEVNSFYRGVAGIITTSKEKELILNWVKTNNISYRFSPSERGTFVVIYSKNKNEFKRNKIKLNEIFREARKAL